MPSPLPEIVARVGGQSISIRQILPLAKGVLDRMPPSERERRLPEVLRDTLQRYVSRELLLQEALARGIKADARMVDWAYDQARREHRDEAAWKEFLAKQALDPQSFRAELRIQQTVAALLEQEIRAFPLAEDELRSAYAARPLSFAAPAAKDPPPFESVRDEIARSLRRNKSDEIAAALLARLRARTRIELLL